MQFFTKLQHWSKGTKARLDIAVVLLLVGGMWLFLHSFEAFEEFYEFSRAHEDWELDEIILFLVVLPIPLIWFALRRAREAQRAAQRTWEIERELSHARKLESLGTLAGGMAHELNNQLQPVLGLSELLVSTAKPDDPHLRKYKLIYQGAERARGTVQRVLNFARRDQAANGGLATANAMRNLLDFLEITCPSSIRFKTHVSDDIGVIDMPLQDVESVVVNLVSNAIAAMEGRSGDMLVRATRGTTGEDKGQQTVLIEVKDEGAGILPENENRIFEPFFTTKDVGKGVGLGMWQVHALIEESNGKIWFKSEPEKGTVFYVELPTKIETDGSEG